MAKRLIWQTRKWRNSVWQTGSHGEMTMAIQCMAKGRIPKRGIETQLARPMANK